MAVSNAAKMIAEKDGEVSPERLAKMEKRAIDMVSAAGTNRGIEIIDLEEALDKARKDYCKSPSSSTLAHVIGVMLKLEEMRAQDLAATEFGEWLKATSK